MRFFTLPLLASALIASTSAMAKPELAPAALLDYGHYEKVEELTVYGDIQQDIIQLAENNTADSDADLFVIDDINEDIEKNVLIVSLSLYVDLNSGIVKR
ncbi:hypothetical protein [Enterovibrio norvegicus]|uniref:Uncharacterized protein n=1 Tax=Enterovibrio norvegicus TaxID=188144 RepID=A0A2N7LDQ8_9GAMM|nr:hypothetical protein [Enterovibrio norvegicus]PMN93533.1 hypothetical protein BCT23_12310 [Enterovibrio norvegicus]